MDYSDKGIWERKKGICSGCHREITNKAYFSGAHVRGTCQRDPGYKPLKPKWSIPLPHPSKAVLNRTYTDQEALAAKYDDWNHETTPADYLAGTARGGRRVARLPETLSELCQWWHLEPMG